MSIDQDIAKSAKTLEADVKINHDITHGDDITEIPTEGGPVPSIRKRLKDIETEWAKTADPLADDLKDAVQLTVNYKDQAAISVVSAAAYTTETANNTQLSRQYRDESGTSAVQAIQASIDSDKYQSLSQQYSASANDSANDALISETNATNALDQIGVNIVALSTSLIKTQTIITTNHAFR